MPGRSPPHDSSGPDLSLRTATQEDAAFLADMLAIAASWRDTVPPPTADVLADPVVSRYLSGWPRPGDAGVVALDGGRPVGAAWWRRFTPDDPGYGFVDDRTPELSIGVVADRRRRGIGSRLLGELVVDARRHGLAALSLSVEPDNPARHLYERLGFRLVAERGGSLTMLHLLGTAEPAARPTG